MNEDYNLIIIGAGPIGLACALEAQKNGISYIVLEKGCLVNSLYHYPINMTFFSTSERLEIGNVPFVSISPKPTRNEALEYYRRVSVSNQLKINLFEGVEQVQKIQNGFVVKTAKQTYQAKTIIISTGFYDLPYKLHVVGENLAKVTHYYKDPHFYAFQKVVVTGAQNSGVDAALETWRKGAEVTMVIRESEVGKRVKYWARPDIVNRIEEGSIKAYFNSYITKITEHEVEIQTPDKLVIIANDWVIAMTGYQPNLEFLKNAGIELSADFQRKPTYNAKTHETNIPGLYLAGVICGGMDTHSLFIENSRVHAQMIMVDIVTKYG